MAEGLIGGALGDEEEMPEVEAPITLRDALTSRGVVIESFDTPSSLAAGGITGKVQQEVSEVGISIGEIRRLLKARFGHDLHISGDVVEAPSDLALTVRGDGEAAEKCLSACAAPRVRQRSGSGLRKRRKYRGALVI